MDELTMHRLAQVKRHNRGYYVHEYDCLHPNGQWIEGKAFPAANGTLLHTRTCKNCGLTVTVPVDAGGEFI